ncbi:hypothetical protein [Streptomyces sp. SGAir0957]
MRIRKRIVAGVAVAVAALAVTGCSSDDGDGGKDEGAATSSAAPDGGASSGAPSGSAGTAGSAGSTEGIWSATTDGKAVVLVVGDGQVALSTGDGHLCNGTVSGTGKPVIDLTCADGSTDRAKGTIASNDGSTMKVSWKDGTEDTFTKSTDGKLPTGLPSGLPTG